MNPDDGRLPTPPAHLAEPGARELLLDTPEACPAYPGLTLDGIAVTADGQRRYLVVTVARRGLIIAAAFRTYPGDLGSLETGAGILAWLAACWTEAEDEIDGSANP